MVAKIKSGQNLIGALNYNEQKVRNGKADLIDAPGYVKNPEELSFHDKLFRLTDLAERNERTKSKAVHISLNFAANEDLDDQLFRQITADYMGLIGFTHQPYLAYRHYDAGHPHVHIVSTNITPAGKRIELNMLGKTKSSAARKIIEKKYGLVQTGMQLQPERPARVKLLPVTYGKSETKRAVTNIVNEVVNTYRFTSIPELNAVLRNYHVTADRGAKGSKMFLSGGLVYWITDDTGNKLGIPIKASSIYGQPTLKTLENHFSLNEMLRKPHKQKITNDITEILQRSSSKSDFQKLLASKGIQVLLRHNTDGRLYGVTFIDHNTKAVFKGSDLGKEFNANALAIKFSTTYGIAGANDPGNGEAALQVFQKRPVASDPVGLTLNGSVLDELLKEEYQDMAAAGSFIRRRRKKKRKGYSL